MGSRVTGVPLQPRDCLLHEHLPEHQPSTHLLWLQYWGFSTTLTRVQQQQQPEHSTQSCQRRGIIILWVIVNQSETRDHHLTTLCPFLSTTSLPLCLLNTLMNAAVRTHVSSTLMNPSASDKVPHHHLTAQH